MVAIQCFGTDINVQPQIPSSGRDEFATVTIFLFQFGICAPFVSVTWMGVGVVVVHIVVITIASVIEFGVRVVSKVVRSARVLFSVILAGGYMRSVLELCRVTYSDMALYDVVNVTGAVLVKFQMMTGTLL